MKRQDISNDEKVSKIIHKFSGVCALVAIQPIPFADIYLLTPIQIFMGKKIATIRGYSLEKMEIKNLIKDISGIIGLGVFAQQTVIILYKIGLPGLGGFMTIPLVYGLTYAIGKIIDYYIDQKQTGKEVKVEDISELIKKYFVEGKKIGKEKVKDVLKSYKKESFAKKKMSDLKGRLFEAYKELYTKNPQEYMGACEISIKLKLSKKEHGEGYLKVYGFLHELKAEGFLEQRGSDFRFKM